jgi:ubiquitin C-terminal hydrolase
MRGSVSRAYRKFVRAMTLGRTNPVSASGLHAAVGRHYPPFNDFQQHDSHEFIVVLLDAPDEELNCSPKAKGAPRPRGLAGIALHAFCHDSIVSRLFHGFSRTTFTYDCGHVESVEEPLMSWGLPLPRGSRSTTFQDCVGLWHAIERLDGDDTPTCDVCQQRIPANRTQQVWRFAPVLIVRLNRFKTGPNGSVRKRSVGVTYPMQINAKEYQTDPESTPGLYHLSAVIVHSGTSSGGHYICIVRDPIGTAKWYAISDSFVSAVPESRAQTADAYVLFYTQSILPISPEGQIGSRAPPYRPPSRL